MARPARPRLRAGLAKRGIERPYIHQADAIEAVHAGEDVVVVPNSSDPGRWAGGPSLRTRLMIWPAVVVIGRSTSRRVGCAAPS